MAQQLQSGHATAQIVAAALHLAKNIPGVNWRSQEGAGPLHPRAACPPCGSAAD
ncbi:hypothetical protein SHM7688_02466 [Shimia marina]|uniref:Uncharacterized protein n=1 Tax=Shimia marina TaxID=321267 RepID=A0A0P1ERC7_9RHOB|nr:hypothetical protein SHM7688_02466 [Shimia marina]